jgi:ABC-type glycerol-3-phosphate transport system substrate-binding protein
MYNSKRRNFGLAVLIFSLLISLLFCFKTGVVNAKAIELTAITQAGGMGPPAKLAIDMANEKYKGEILVNTVSIPWGVQFEKTMAEFIGKSTTYDIIPIHTWWLGATAKYMEDLTPLVKKYNVNLNVFAPGMIKWSTWENRLIGLPFRTGSAALFYYRKDLYDKYGLKVPGTMEQYYQNAKIITEKEKNIYGASLMSGGNPFIYEDFTTWFYAQGGRLLNEEQNDVAPFEGANGKLAIEILGMWKKLHDEKFLPPAHTTWGIMDVLKAMQQNLVAQTNAFSPRVLAVENPKESKTVGKWGYSPMFPGSAGKIGPIGYSSIIWSFGINPLISAERKEAAFKVIQVMASEEAQKRAAIEAANDPILTSVYKSSEYLKMNPAALEIIKCLEKFYAIVVPQNPEIMVIVSEEGGNAIMGKKNPEEAARSMWKRIKDTFTKK